MNIKIFTTLSLLVLSLTIQAQAPALGTSASFVLFSTNGSVTNTGISHLTGNVGTNNGSSTGFGNVNGNMHDGGVESSQAAVDLLIAYNQLNATVPNYFPAALLGNGQTLVEGVYQISGATVLNNTLNLNAQGDTNAVFIFQIQGSFSANANAKVMLLNGAKACNVFWKVEGLVSIAAGVFIRGTIIANNAAINLSTNDTLEGRAMSTAGAITIDGVLAYTPVGCGSPLLTGPTAPFLGGTACYALFSSNGPVSNSGVTFVTGDVGTNNGLTTGFNAANVNGTIHLIPDGSTSQCASDLTSVANYLNALPPDIELLYPAQFGNSLVLTPHTYIMNGAVTFTDSLYLNAQGNPNATFVIQVMGAFSTSTYSNIILINGAQSKNVYWIINGAVDIDDYSIFRGTLVCNNGALGALNTGVLFDGRALTTTGAMSTTAATANATMIPGNCGTLDINDNSHTTSMASVFPNPFSESLTVTMNGAWNETVFTLYNTLGEVVMCVPITSSSTTIDTGSLPAGAYSYTINGANEILQTGTMIGW